MLSQMSSSYSRTFQFQKFDADSVGFTIFDELGLRKDGEQLPGEPFPLSATTNAQVLCTRWMKAQQKWGQLVRSSRVLCMGATESSQSSQEFFMISFWWISHKLFWLGKAFVCGGGMFFLRSVYISKWAMSSEFTKEAAHA